MDGEAEIEVESTEEQAIPAGPTVKLTVECFVGTDDHCHMKLIWDPPLDMKASDEPVARAQAALFEGLKRCFRS